MRTTLERTVDSLLRSLGPLIASSVLWVSLGVPGTLGAGEISRALIVALEGEPGPPGTTVVQLEAPTVSAGGSVGFSGGLEDDNGEGDVFISHNGTVVWRNSDEIFRSLEGGAGPIGISDSGGFIYSPTVDGLDSVWTHSGLLMLEGDAATGFPEGTVTTFHNRPSMTDFGAVHWVAGFDESGSGATEGRVLYRSVSALPGAISIALRADDVMDGMTVARGAGIDLDYDISDDGLHHIHPLLMVTGSPDDDGTLTVDGSIVLREGDPIGAGDNWDNFDLVAINNHGRYLASGDTDGPDSVDNFVAVDGAIAVRESGIVDGVVILDPATLQALAINNQNQAAYAWAISGGVTTLFHSCAIDTLAASSVALLSSGEMIDTDGDGSPDTTIEELRGGNGTGPSLALADDGALYVGAVVDIGDGVHREAILEVETPSCDQIDLQLSGTCPGVVTLDAVGGTPGASVLVLQSTGLGNAALPLGACTGTPSRLADVNLVTTLSFDGTGELSVSPNASPAICGRHLQLIDLATCGVSNYVTLP